MTLDEDGEVLRWYKNETRSGFNAMDGQLYTKYVLFACTCVFVHSPFVSVCIAHPFRGKEGFTTIAEGIHIHVLSQVSAVCLFLQVPG